MSDPDTLKLTPKERLEAIAAQIKSLEEQRREIYRASLEAPDDEKVCADVLAEMCAEEPWGTFEYPIEVHGINWEDGMGRDFPPRLVQVKPCNEEKTYVGILVGDLPLGVGITFHAESGVLTASPTHYNPAIVVPELRRIVMGAESWWSPIESEDQLTQIADEDIEGVWYVKALKSFIGEE